MNDYIEDYINYVYIEKKLSNNTKMAYERDLKAFASYLNNKNIENITANDIKDYIGYLNNIKEKDKSIARKIVSIRTFLII